MAQYQGNTAAKQDNDSSSDNGIENTIGEERPFKCSQCFKIFRKKVHLNQHQRIHSNEKPYVCEYFEKRFTQF